LEDTWTAYRKPVSDTLSRDRATKGYPQQKLRNAITYSRGETLYLRGRQTTKARDHSPAMTMKASEGLGMKLPKAFASFRKPNINRPLRKITKTRDFAAMAIKRTDK
jgi:hypothetical protein